MENRYPLPEELARHAPGVEFDAQELRKTCKEAGEKLGFEDARDARFQSAAGMVALWRGLDLPAWKAPYILRDTRLGYLNGYGRALVDGRLSGESVSRAAEARWGRDWRGRLEAARKRAGR